MFTVIICNSHIKEDCNKFKSYLRPLLENGDFAFCNWYHEADNLLEAAPDLPELIKSKSEWRALIIHDSEIAELEGINKRNPFDYVGEVKVPADFGNSNEILEFRQAKREAYVRAISNPLLKLTNWLAGISMSERPVIPAEFADLPAIDDEEYFEILDYKDINPIDVELARLRQEKYDLLVEHFQKDGVIFKKPKELLVLSERMLNGDFKRTESVFAKHNEFRYTRFCEDNLYNPKLRYLLYDIDYLSGKRNSSIYFKFLTVILLLATKDVPVAPMRPYAVYNLRTEDDEQLVKAACAGYVKKLQATDKKIRSSIITEQRKRDGLLPVEDKVSERVFESDVKIPVRLDKKYSNSDFYADYASIGLAKDCPRDEERNWESQFYTIKKKFLRYLREPRRSVQSASETEFRQLNSIEDPRALLLTEFQKEDVQYRLEEEESNMVATHTNNIFDTDEYAERMDEADKELKRTIRQRMTRKRTIIAGLIAVGFYLFGFLPLIFSGLNNIGTLAASLIFIGVAVGAFLIVGFVELFVLRHKLKNRFKHFNFVMGGIISEIRVAMEQFSKYLSHACNVMREFSVFGFIKNNETEETRTIKVMKYHLNEINDKIEEVTNIFGSYIDSNVIDRLEEAAPYHYDFAVCKHYDYDMPYRKEQNRIEFIQRGHEIEAPIDYIKAVILEREQLYD